MSNSRNNEARIYVGNLPPDIRTKDIEDLFYKFGKIAYIDLKNRRGPPFAFVEFEDPRDAEDAVHARDGYDYDGYRLRVEFPRGSQNSGGGGGNHRGNGGRTGGGGGGGRGDGEMGAAVEEVVGPLRDGPTTVFLSLVCLPPDLGRI